MEIKEEQVKQIDQNTYEYGDIQLHNSHGKMNKRMAADTLSQIIDNMESDHSDK